MRRKKNKTKYFSTQATNISIFSKIVIVVLVIGMLMGHLNLGVLAKALEPEVYTTVTDDVERDFSKFEKIEEVNSLRTSNSKTYLKENGMYETEYYGEKIHYKDNDDWKEIDNSLSLGGRNQGKKIPEKLWLSDLYAGRYRGRLYRGCHLPRGKGRPG